MENEKEGEECSSRPLLLPKWKEKEMRKRQRKLERQKRKEARTGASSSASSPSLEKPAMKRKFPAASDIGKSAGSMSVVSTMVEESSAGADILVKKKSKKRKTTQNHDSDKESVVVRAERAGVDHIAGHEGSEDLEIPTAGLEDRKGPIEYPFAVTAQADHAEVMSTKLLALRRRACFRPRDNPEARLQACCG